MRQAHDQKGHVFIKDFQIPNAIDHHFEMSTTEFPLYRSSLKKITAKYETTCDYFFYFFECYIGLFNSCAIFIHLRGNAMHRIYGILLRIQVSLFGFGF